MNKKLLKIGSAVLSLGMAITPAASVCAADNVSSLSAQNTPSVYTASGTFTITNGVQDGKWYFDAATGLLDIYGTGSLGGSSSAPWFNGNHPWKDYRASVKEIVFHEGITDISNQAIGHASELSLAHTSLEKITLPSTMTFIAYGAFANCTNLKEINFSEGLETLAQGAFVSTAVEKLVFPNSLKTIGVGAFNKCYSLKSIKFGNSVSSILRQAFYDCTALESVSPFPETLTLIAGNAFGTSSQTSTLKSVTFLGDLPGFVSENIDATINSVFNRRRYLNVHYNAAKTGWSTLSPDVSVVLHGDVNAESSVSDIWIESDKLYSIYEKGDTVNYTIKWNNKNQNEKKLQVYISNFNDMQVYSTTLELNGTDTEKTLSIDGDNFEKGAYIVTAQIGDCKSTAQLAVAEKLENRRNTDNSPVSFAAMATHTYGGGASMDEYAKTIKLAGINSIRDFCLITELTNEDGTYKFGSDKNLYNTYFDAYKKYGIKVLFMLNTIPNYWTEHDNESVPYDPTEMYDLVKAFCETYEGKIDTVEIFNEIDTGYENRFTTPDSHAAALKAAALGAADSDTGVKIATCGFCGGMLVSNQYRNSFLLNDTAKYFDYYIGHDYIDYSTDEIIQKSTFPRVTYAQEIARFGKKTSQLSEFGIRIPYTAEDKELTADEQQRQARSAPVNLINAMANGYGDSYWFIHSYINEYEKCYGTMNKKREPYMIYSAISAFTNALGNAEYTGEFNSLDDGTYGHKFTEGNEQIACLWSDEETTVQLNTNANAVTVIDIMGNEKTLTSDNGIYAVPVSSNITYVRVKGNITNAVSVSDMPIATTSEFFKDTVTDSDRIITKMFFEDSAYKKHVMFDGYRLSAESTNSASVTVYNMSDKDVSGSLEFASNAGWKVSGNYTDITVPAHGKKDITLTIDGSDVSAFGVKTQIFVRGTFDGKRISDSTVNVNTLENYTPTDNVFNGFADDGYWTKSMSQGVTVTDTKISDNEFKFTTDFTASPTGGVGRYHKFTSSDAFVGTSGFSFNFKTDTEPLDGEHVEMLVQGHVYTTDGCHYYTTLLKNADRYTHNYLYADSNWQQAVFQWTDFACASTGHDHSGIKLDPSKIATIGFGFGPKSGETVVDFSVKDFGLMNFENYSLSHTITDATYEDGNIVATLNAGNVSGVRFKDEEGRIFKADVNGNTVTAEAKFGNGSHNITAYIFDNYNSAYEDTFSINIEEKFTLTYNTMGGVSVPVSQTVDGAYATVTSYKPQKTGYTFKGWSSVLGGDAEYHAGDKIYVAEDINLYPVFASGVEFGSKALYSKYALVKGNSKDDKGKSATLVVTKGKNIDDVTSFDDIYYMDEVIVDSDGNYAFVFPTDENIASCKAFLTVDSTSKSVSLQSSAVGYDWLDTNVTALVSDGKVAVTINDINFAADNVDYTPIVAFYNSDGNLIKSHIFSATAKNDGIAKEYKIDIPKDASSAKVFVWSSVGVLVPIEKAINLNV